MKKSGIIIVTSLFLIVLSQLTVWGLQQKQIIFKKAQNASPTKPAVSEWSPIDLTWYNQQNDKNTNEVQGKLEQLKKEISLSKQEKDFKQDLYERSLKIYQIEKEEYNLMDENKDGKIDYPEFNKRTIEVYERTFPLKHIKRKDKPDGLYDENWNSVKSGFAKQISDTSFAGALYVIIEGGIYDRIYSSLMQYKQDVETEGQYQVWFSLCNGCTKESIRDLLRTPGVLGTVFAGDLPAAWFYDTYYGYGNTYPDDLYFMDINGVFGGETNCSWGSTPYLCFTTHGGDTNPEIIFGRLAVPSQSRKIELLINYFRKNHNYRRRWTENLPFRALNYFDNAGTTDALIWAEAVRAIYSDTTFYSDPAIISASHYRSLWQNGYQNLFLVAHGNQWVNWINGSGVDSLQVRDQKPRFNFYTMHPCAANGFAASDYINGWYVFQESDSGLVAVGSTKSVCLQNDQIFYQTLGRFEDIGTAMKNQYTNHARNRYCFGGLTLIGDPTLKITTSTPLYNCSACDANNDGKFCEDDTQTPLYRECYSSLIPTPNPPTPTSACLRLDVNRDFKVNGQDFSLCATYCYSGSRCLISPTPAPTECPPPPAPCGDPRPTPNPP